MPILAHEKRLTVLAALVDGNSVRATERMTGVNLRTILRFAVTLGEGAQRLHNAMARDLASPMVETDEIWSYVGKKQARVTPEENAAGLGEAYTFVALGMPSRFANLVDRGQALRIPAPPGRPFQPDPGSRSDGTRAAVPVTRAAIPMAPGQRFR